MINKMGHIWLKMTCWSKTVILERCVLCILQDFRFSLEMTWEKLEIDEETKLHKLCKLVIKDS